MPTVTTFNLKGRYIFLPLRVWTEEKGLSTFKAILDTGAPRTEISDASLFSAGFGPEPKSDIPLQAGLQTQKYADLTLPRVEICSHRIENLTVYVSHFEKSWGIDALIGLDFFRRFRVTIDYAQGAILSEPYTSTP
jgi:predicted aspartyl protease